MATILIIDDSKSALALTESFLIQGGHRVISSLSAKAAMTVLSWEKVDLIVTDIYMPEEDGLEVIRRARRDCPHIPVIAVSGATGIKDVRRVALALGAAGTLQKPFSKEQLLQAVRGTMATAVGVRQPSRGVPLA